MFTVVSMGTKLPMPLPLLKPRSGGAQNHECCAKKAAGPCAAESWAFCWLETLLLRHVTAASASGLRVIKISQGQVCCSALYTALYAVRSVLLFRVFCTPECLTFPVFYFLEKAQDLYRQEREIQDCGLHCLSPDHSPECGELPLSQDAVLRER